MKVSIRKSEVLILNHVFRGKRSEQNSGCGFCVRSRVASAVLSSPPFEVTESGWGEFEVNIKIHFKDNIEKPVEIFHLLRLFPPFGTEMSKKPVVSEHYDELIFQDPTENLFKILKAGPSAKFKISTYAPYFTSFDGQELKELKQIEEARKKLRHDKLTLEDKFNDLEVEREELARELTRLGGKM